MEIILLIVVVLIIGGVFAARRPRGRDTGNPTVDQRKGGEN